MDLRREVNLAELVGLIIGDGSILYRYRGAHYRLSIVGDVYQDIEYFDEVRGFIYELTGKLPKIRIRKMELGFGLDLYINDKELVCFLVEELGLDYGKKTYIVKIPNKFNAPKYSSDVLRGLFESDGSLYFSRSKVIKYPNYPRIEIGTVSKVLAQQIFTLLKQKKFDVHIIQTRYNYYKIYLSGETMLEKWIKEIGFSNNNTLTKYYLWKKLGYYIPKLTFSQRKKLLKEPVLSCY